MPFVKIGKAIDPAARESQLPDQYDLANSYMFVFTSEALASNMEKSLHRTFIHSNVHLIHRGDGYTEHFCREVSPFVLDHMARLQHDVAITGHDFIVIKGIPDMHPNVEVELKKINDKNVPIIDNVINFIAASISANRPLDSDTSRYIEKDRIRLTVKNREAETETELKADASGCIFGEALSWPFQIGDNFVVARPYDLVGNVRGFDRMRSGRGSGNPWSKKNKGIRFDIDLAKLQLYLRGRCVAGMEQSIAKLGELEQLLQAI